MNLYKHQFILTVAMIFFPPKMVNLLMHNFLQTHLLTRLHIPYRQSIIKSHV